MSARKSNKLLSLIFAVAMVVLIITVSISLPIYIREFYYLHVRALDLPGETGWTYEEIVTAYDETLDYLTIDGKEFSTGVLKYSEEGKSHFEDCKGLFDLNKCALILSLGVVVLLGLVDKMRLIRLAKPFGLRLSFWSGLLTLLGFASLGVVCAQDFSRAFTVFHKIFFPGKDNWMFHPKYDQIILVLPQEFFMSCAILICASILLISFTFVLRGIKKRGH